MLALWTILWMVNGHLMVERLQLETTAVLLRYIQVKIKNINTKQLEFTNSFSLTFVIRTKEIIHLKRSKIGHLYVTTT